MYTYIDAVAGTYWWYYCGHFRGCSLRCYIFSSNVKEINQQLLLNDIKLQIKLNKIKMYSTKINKNKQNQNQKLT